MDLELARRLLRPLVEERGWPLEPVGIVPFGGGWVITSNCNYAPGIMLQLDSQGKVLNQGRRLLAIEFTTNDYYGPTPLWRTGVKAVMAILTWPFSFWKSATAAACYSRESDVVESWGNPLASPTEAPGS